MEITSEYLRLVKDNDKELLLEWANDGVVRSNSFNSNPIERDEHEQWFQGLMQSSREFLYIYVVNNLEVGQVRITLEEDTAEIHYSVCKEMRNKGLAKRMLGLLKEELRVNYPHVVHIIAKVKSNNEASKRVLKSIGFHEDGLWHMQMD